MKPLLYKPLFYVLLIVLLGSGLRLYHLGFKSLWLDEAVIYLNAQGTLSEILEKNATENSAPPTFTLLVRAMMFFGESEFWLRLPACLAGIASIPLAFVCFRRFSGDWGAVFGTLLLAVAPTQILYSQQVREYSFVVLLTLALFYFFFDCIHTRTTKSFLLFSLTAATAILFQYGIVLAIAGLLATLFVYLLIQHRERILPLCASLLPTVLSVLFVYWIALRHQFRIRSATYLANAYVGNLLSSWPGFFCHQTNTLLQFCVSNWVYPLLVLTLILGVLASFIEKRFLSVISALSLFGVVIVANILAVYPYGPLRQVIFLAVPIYLVASMGSQYLMKHSAKAVYITAAFLICLWGGKASLYYLRQESQYNMKPTAHIWETQLLDDDHIFVSYHSAPAFYYYFPELQNRSIATYPNYYSGLESLNPGHDGDIINSTSGRVWMLFSLYDPGYLEQTVEMVRTRRHIRCMSDPNDYVRLYLVTDSAETR